MVSAPQVGARVPCPLYSDTKADPGCIVRHTPGGASLSGTGGYTDWRDCALEALAGNFLGRPIRPPRGDFAAMDFGSKGLSEMQPIGHF